MSATTTTLPRFLLHLPHPVAAHRVPLPPDPTCQPRCAASPAPHRPPLSCNSAAAPPDTTGRGAGPPSPSFSCPHATPSRPPPSSFFPRRPALTSAFNSHQPPTSLPFLSNFLLHPLRALLIPSSPSLSASSFGRLTALPPGVQATAGFDFPPPW
jgi:hypothetical protein